MDYNAAYEDLYIPRSTYDDCVNYIAEEMKLAAKDLPLKRDTRNMARPTRGAALATRAKALLYAASLSIIRVQPILNVLRIWWMMKDAI